MKRQKNKQCWLCQNYIFRPKQKGVTGSPYCKMIVDGKQRGWFPENWNYSLDRIDDNECLGFE